MPFGGGVDGSGGKGSFKTGRLLVSTHVDKTKMAGDVGDYRQNDKFFPMIDRDREDGTTFRLVHSGGRLDARMPGLPDAELIFDGPQEFRVVEYGVAGRVIRDGSGRLALEYRGVDGRRHRAEKQ